MPAEGMERKRGIGPRGSREVTLHKADQEAIKVQAGTGTFHSNIFWVQGLEIQV